MPTNTLSVQKIETVSCFCIGICQKMVLMPLYENGVVKCPDCKRSFKLLEKQTIELSQVPAPSIYTAD